MKTRLMLIALFFSIVNTPIFCQEKSLYAPEQEIVKTLENLGEGEAVFLPNAKHKLNGIDIKAEGYLSSPYARDYTTKMVYAPERQTALYCGGNHGKGRTNDVWEYHLASNTWHCLFEADGGDHANHKGTLMFLPNKFVKDPNYQMDEKETELFALAKEWWLKNVDFKDGHYLTKRGGTLLHGHTWDTLVYDESIKKLIQGNGAHCAQSPWLQHKFTGMPMEEVQQKLGKNPNGVPYKTMWLFDPEEKKWIHYASHDALAELRGMGASLCYLPDLKKTVCYVSAQNVTPNAFHMRLYDGVADKWEELKPNGGQSISTLSIKLKVAPSSETQLRYSPKHKKIVAVLATNTFCYDVVKNEWSLLNSNIPFKANDANTIFEYDSTNDVFLLVDCRALKIASFDLKTNEWKTIEAKGAQLKKPPYCVGKGYYDPTYNVLVVQSAYTPYMWVYRHGKPEKKQE